MTNGTNGFFNGQYSYASSIAQDLGSSNLADPNVFPIPALPKNGGQFKSAVLSNQTIITADTFQFNDQWVVQNVVSPTVSLIYKPFAKITAYVTSDNHNRAHP